MTNPRKTLGVATLVAWLWTFVIFTLFSLVTPLWSTPDAPAHDLMAYYVARGDLTPPSTDEVTSVVTNANTPAPAGLVNSAATVGCTAFQATIPASCIAPVTNDATIVDYINSAGLNMPMYYVATGWPSLFVPNTLAIPANRLAAAALASLFVAWAASAAWTRRRRATALMGVVVATTPMVAYMGGAVNPNSLEITAAMALGASTLVFLHEPDSDLGRIMFRRAMIAATIMVTIRMLAPVWVLVWAVAVAVLASPAAWKALRQRRQLAWMALPTAGAIFDVVWTRRAGLTDIQDKPMFNLNFWDAFFASKDRIDSATVHEQVAVYGWLDTPLSPEMYWTYLWVTIFILATAWIYLSRRQALVAMGLTFAAYLVPIVLQAAQWNNNGPVWQGRYTLPLTVLIPIAIMFLAADRPVEETPRALLPRLSWAYALGALLLCYVHIQGLLTLMRRNTNGLSSTKIFDGPWEPFLGNEVLAATYLALLLALWAFLTQALLREVSDAQSGDTLSEHVAAR